MIPSLVLFGIIFGRWWKFSLVTATVAWPLLLVVTHVMGIEWGLIGAGALAIANTLTGALVHQGVLWVVRRARGDPFPLRRSV